MKWIVRPLARACIASSGPRGRKRRDGGRSPSEVLHVFARNDKPTELHRAFADDVLKASNQRFHIRVFRVGRAAVQGPGRAARRGDQPGADGRRCPRLRRGRRSRAECVRHAVLLHVDGEVLRQGRARRRRDVDGVLTRKFKTRSIMQWVMPPQQLWLVKPVAESTPEEPEGALLEPRAGGNDEAARRVGVTITPRGHPGAAARRGRRRVHRRRAGAGLEVQR